MKFKRKEEPAEDLIYVYFWRVANLKPTICKAYWIDAGANDAEIMDVQWEELRDVWVPVSYAKKYGIPLS